MDRLTKQQRSRNMAKIRSVNTGPEILVRRVAHRLGFRFRLHRKDLPGTPDLVFPARQQVILVHGCFWHTHDCAVGRHRPKSNVKYWTQKLDRNIARDKKQIRALKALGWKPLVIWECQTKDIQLLSAIILRFLK